MAGAKERVWPTFVSAIVASIMALLIGYTVGFPSSALLDLTEDSARLPADYRLSVLLSDVFAAIAPVGAVFGAPLAGYIADHWGRKPSLLLCGVPYLTGYLMISYAHYLPTPTAFKGFLLSGRFITGIGIGWAGSSGPVYIGELSSAKLRGIFGSFTQIALAAGILLTYAISTIPDFPYYYNSLVAAGLVAVFECAMVLLYETPRWLLLRGRSPEARRTLQWLRGLKADLDAEVSSIESTKMTTSTWQAWKEIARDKKKLLAPLSVVIFAMFFHQIGGATVIASYAAVLFEEAGVPQPRVTATYAVGGVEFLATLFSVFVIDIVGRKILLVLSGAGMSLGAALLGVHFYLTRPSLCSSSSSPLNSTVLLFSAGGSNAFENCRNPQLAPLAISSVILFIIAYSIGWGPVPWVLLSELIPGKVRGFASGLATTVNWMTLSLVIGVYLEYAGAVREWFAWWSFAVINALSVVFTIVVVKETKGKSLEHIEEHYHKI